MPIQLSYSPSFKRSTKRLGRGEVAIVKSILKALIVYYINGCNLSEAQNVAPRFFYKQLRKPYYEAGVEGKIRIVIEKRGNQCMAILAGNHDQIKQFLKNV
ncbi:MAG: hypothetical protein KKH94_12325 [Candidatus Omnitrophica bacterium]|nr:hypothetical protein [Candidatus Omnitrophota bacterium]